MIEKKEFSIVIFGLNNNYNQGLLNLLPEKNMNVHDKKTALRMIPYGLYIITAESSDGRVAAATINWVTQASFEPPLVAVGIKADSQTHDIIKERKCFALNILGKGQQGQAFTFFKALVREGNSIGGESFHSGQTGSPILENTPAFVECNLVETVEKGDHSIFIGEVINSGINKQPEGRADDAILWLKDLGEKVYYGG